MRNILITSLGATTAITAIKLLRGKDVRIIGTDMLEFKELPSSRMVDMFYMVPPVSEEDEYIDAICEIAKIEKIDIIIPIYDKEIEVLSKNILKLKPFLMCPPYETVMKCNDKWLTYNMFLDSGLKTPFTSIATIDKRKIIIKPIDGVGSRDITIEEPKYTRIVPDGYIAQEFIEGQEYTIDCCCNLYRNLQYCVPRKRIKVINGICTRGETVDNKKFIDDIEDLLKHNRFTGPFNVQCIEDKKGDIYYIEVNPRLGASTIITKHAGIDIGQIFLDIYYDKFGAVREVNNNYKKVRMIRYLSEEVYDL